MPNEHAKGIWLFAIIDSFDEEGKPVLTSLVILIRFSHDVCGIAIS